MKVTLALMCIGRPIHHEAVGVPAGSRDAEETGAPATGAITGGEIGKLLEIAPVERQLNDAAIIDHVPWLAVSVSISGGREETSIDCSSAPTSS